MPLFFLFDPFLGARAEILWFFGRNDGTKKTFWNKLTFSCIFRQNSENFWNIYLFSNLRFKEEFVLQPLCLQKTWFSFLSNLFQNGQITQERILVLFFFCSDVAILAIRQGATALVEQLTRWSLEFIKKQVKRTNPTFPELKIAFLRYFSILFWST